MISSIDIKISPLISRYLILAAMARHRHRNVSKVSNVRIGSGRASIGTNENEPRLSPNCTRSAVEKNGVSCEDYSSRILLSYGSL